MLAIQIEFLTGRYVATAYNSRTNAEWPPHPARFFSALAATHFANDPPDKDERGALEWLEAQAPPSIEASEEYVRDIVTVYVPVNDVGLTDVDEESHEVDGLRVALAMARATAEAKSIKRAEVALSKAEQRLAKAVAAQTGVPRTERNPRLALKVLPEHRVKQPRTFPSVTPSDPRVTYLWPIADASAEQRRAIGGLLRRLVRLGHSSSLVVARLADGPVAALWRPATDGERVMRVVQPGQLAALERSFAPHRETEPRVMPARFEAYTRRLEEDTASIPHSTFEGDWLVFRRVGGPMVPMQAAAAVARAMRKALLSHAATIGEVLSGHSPSGQPSQADHLAIIPLPFVGHPQASGAILGVALVLPRDVSQEDRRTVFAAVDAWERAERREDEDTPSLSLRLGPAGVLELERTELRASQATLRASTWCAPAKTWHSVTPVALDHNPGDLHSSQPAKVKKALEEAEATIRRACRRVGLPQPDAVHILPSPTVACAAKARHYPPFPDVADRTRRVLTHVCLEFAERVVGPVLLGAGRYVGLGLFRPDLSNG